MWRQYRKIYSEEFFLVAADLGAGAGDQSVAQFISKTRCDVPLVFSTFETATQMTNEIHPVLEKLFDITGISPLVAYERNNGGVYEMERLGSLNYKNKYTLFLQPEHPAQTEHSEKKKYGWTTSTATRSNMLGNLRECLKNRVLMIYDAKTIDECFSFIKVYGNGLWKAQAENNTHDDHVMALAIGWQLYLLSPSLDNVYKNMNTAWRNRQSSRVREKLAKARKRNRR